jgi:hypothetical protein
MEEVNGAIQDIAKYSIQTRREKLKVATPIMEKNKRDLCSVESSSAIHHIHLRAEPFLLLFKCSDHPLSYPCVKIVATFPEGQSVHNLG